LFILIGVVGALLFFAKSVGLFLFLSTWVIWAFIDSVHIKRRGIIFTGEPLRNKLIALATFGILIIPFCLAISVKYGYPTVGTSGTYNLALVGPQTEGHPMMSRGLMPPPNDTALSVWEDISYVPLKTWNPLGSVANLKHLYRTIRSNITTTSAIILATFWPFLFIAIFYGLSAEKEPKKNRFKLLATAIAALTVALYLPIFVEFRYLFVVLVIIMLGFVLFLADQYKKGAKLVCVFGIVTLLLFVQVPIRNLNHNIDMTKIVFDESKALRNVIGPTNHVASDDFGAIYVCYYTKARCYGVLQPTSKDVKQQLQQYHIDRLILAPQAAEQLKSSGILLEQIEGLRYSGRDIYIVRF